MVWLWLGGYLAVRLWRRFRPLIFFCMSGSLLDVVRVRGDFIARFLCAGYCGGEFLINRWRKYSVQRHRRAPAGRPLITFLGLMLRL